MADYLTFAEELHITELLLNKFSEDTTLSPEEKAVLLGTSHAPAGSGKQILNKFPNEKCRPGGGRHFLFSTLYGDGRIDDIEFKCCLRKI